jgi:peroxiredoxin
MIPNTDGMDGPDMNNLTGKPAPPFSLHDSNGVVHLLADFKGSWLLMVFHRHLG